MPGQAAAVGEGSGVRSTSMAFLEALAEAGVEFVFANFGSDHPAMLEAFAEARATGRAVPRPITCPTEMVAMSCAHGHAQVSRRAQAVVVHVDCGTLALGGAVHNAARDRAPVLVFAGLSPATQAGEAKGGRNEFIQWIQDVPDQRGILRNYVRHENEVRTGRNVRQLVFRALQIASSDPPGPVYLTGAREAMEEALPPGGPDEAAHWAHFAPVAPAALPEAGVEALAADLLAARRPLVVTSYLGRSPAAAAALARLCRRHGIGVLESVPSRCNFPADDPLYQGNQWNHPFQNPSLADADLVLVIDSDVPWIPTVSRPADGARIHHIDLDPLKAGMPLWHIPAASVFRADAATALAQLERRLDAAAPPDPALVAARAAHWARRHAEREGTLAEREAEPGAAITPEYLTTQVRARLDGRSIVLNEGITNYSTVVDHLRPGRPGGLLTSGGGSLGWHGGAAIGAKLAAPDATVVAMTGDGSYMFSLPSTVHWMARHYATPFVTVIYNNRGWKAPRFSMLQLHPSGHASRANDIGVGFDPPPDYAGIAAAAGGALALTVHRPEEVAPALDAAFQAAREEGRCAVVDAWVPSR